MIAEAGSIGYTFNGIQREEWPKIKGSCRYGQVPSLKISDSITIFQTTCIARYLAQEGNLYPSDHIQATLSEEYVATLDELLTKFFKATFYAPEETKEAELKTFIEGPLNCVMTAFDAVISQNGGLMCGSLSWADLYCYDFTRFIVAKQIDLSTYPNVLSLISNVETNEKVKAFVASNRNLRNRK